MRQHADQMLAVDFFTVETVWLQRLHVLFFLEIGSRCVHLAGCTALPTGAWVAQQARQLAWLFQMARSGPGFCSAIETPNSPPASTRSSEARAWMSSICLTDHLGRNSYAERWVGTARREVLDHLLIFGCRHLEYVLQEFVQHYEEARPHQGLGQRTPRQREPTAISEAGPVERRDRLGGVLHEYARQAA